LSGSGATCFALYADPALAGAAAEKLASAHPGWWVVPGRLLA
jgi:4-diphosphocytidyl-2-C-methyl-D-erythritol kinase